MAGILMCTLFFVFLASGLEELFWEGFRNNHHTGGGIMVRVKPGVEPGLRHRVAIGNLGSGQPVG